MDIWLKFLILYSLPIATLASVVGLYLLFYNKDVGLSAHLAFLLIFSGFMASSFLTVTLVIHFMASTNIYSGITFSVLAWLLESIAFSIYVYVFYLS